MVYFKSICGMGEETRLCKLIMNLIIAHLLFGVCVFQFVKPCKTVNVAPGYIVSYRKKDMEIQPGFKPIGFHENLSFTLYHN